MGDEQLMTDDDPWIQAERKHERDMTDMKMRDDRERRQQRNVMVGYIASAVTAVLVVAGIVLLVLGWQRNANEHSQQLEQACIEAGGTWAGINGGGKACVRIEEMPK
jgi:hypothetical protein